MQYLFHRANLSGRELARSIRAVTSLPVFAENYLGTAKVETNQFNCEFKRNAESSLGGNNVTLGDVAPTLDAVLQQAISSTKLRISNVRIELHVPLKLLSSTHDEGDDRQSLHITGEQSNSVTRGLIVAQYGIKKGWYQEYARELPKGAFKRDTATMRRWYQRIDRELRKVFPRMSSGIIE